MRPSLSLYLLVLPLALLLMACAGASNAATACSGGLTGAVSGIDTSELTAREQCEWSSHMNELLAPCPDLAVPLAECVGKGRACTGCVAAAQFLLEQVRDGKPKGQVAELYEQRFDPRRVKTIVDDDSPSLGPANAAVSIVEWADFQCPSCRNMSLVLHEVLARFPKDVRLVFKHYPISFHAFAPGAASAAVAAGAQGKFWPMHKMLFERQDRLADSDLESYATELGLDLQRFREDRASAATEERIVRDKRQGEGLGIHATPTMFINGREVQNASLDNPVEDLSAWIELELRLAGATPPPRPSARATPTHQASSPSAPPPESKP
jgi:protein-disulfide isomerase